MSRLVEDDSTYAASSGRLLMGLWPWCRSSSEWMEECTWSESRRWEARGDAEGLDGKVVVGLDMGLGMGMGSW